MANEYVTVPELKTALSLTGETYADADLAASAEAASRAVDGICNTRFYPGTAGEQRKYSPVSEEYVKIEAATVTTVAATGVSSPAAPPSPSTGTTHRPGHRSVCSAR